MVINSEKMVISYYPSALILGRIYKPMTIIQTFLIWFVVDHCFNSNPQLKELKGL